MNNQSFDPFKQGSPFMKVPSFNFLDLPTFEGCNGWRYDKGSIYYGLYAVVAIISMLACVFVVITIFFGKNLRQHPSTLIGYMCLCEALSCFNALVWAIDPHDFMCYFGNHYLPSYTIPLWSPSR